MRAYSIAVARKNGFNISHCSVAKRLRYVGFFSDLHWSSLNCRISAECDSETVLKIGQPNNVCKELSVYTATTLRCLEMATAVETCSTISCLVWSNMRTISRDWLKRERPTTSSRRRKPKTFCTWCCLGSFCYRYACLQTWRCFSLKTFSI